MAGKTTHIERGSLRAPLLARAVAALALVLTLTPPAAAAEDIVGVEITPARVEVDLQRRSFVIDLLVVNREPDPQRIRLSVSGLGHDLDGTPRFLEPALATRVTRLASERFILAAGARRSVRLQGEIPDGEAALYPAVIAEFEPTSGRGRAAVALRSRVAALLLLRGPRPWVETIAVEDVGVLPAKGRDQVQVFAAVKDTGDVHLRPRGRVDIFKDGRLLDSVPLTPEVILPGFARRLVGLWDPPAGLSGKVDLRAVFSFPEAVGRGSATFVDGLARGPAAAITNLVARSNEGGIDVEFVLTNTGTVAIAPTVRIEALRSDGHETVALLAQGVLAPGASRVVSWQPELDPGLYVITARATFEGMVLDEGVTGLEVVAGGILYLIALALLLLAINALLLVLLHRRHAARHAPATVPLAQLRFWRQRRADRRAA